MGVIWVPVFIVLKCATILFQKMEDPGEVFAHPDPALSQDELSQLDRELSLEKCTMEILNHRKKPNESFMTLVLQFRFEYEPDPKIVGRNFVSLKPVYTLAPLAADLLLKGGCGAK